MQNQYNISIGDESSISAFDKYLASLPKVSLKTWINKKNGRTTQYDTLPTFIRNKIDHPEAKNPNTHTTYRYSSSEFKSSIEWMLSQL